MPVPASSFRTRALFGGAMACDLPDYLEDMSKIRVVPDQQEAFFNGDGSISVIIEVLEYQEVPDAKAAEFFFNDLMEANSALSSRILEPWTALKGRSSVAGHTMASLKGEFDVIKNGASSADHVCVRLAVIRIPVGTLSSIVNRGWSFAQFVDMPGILRSLIYSEHRADIVVSMNERTNDTACLNDAQTGSSESLDRTFHAIIESFKILNYELFA